MSKKSKVKKRKIKLENLVKAGTAYCNKHDCYLTEEMVDNKHCYTGNHGKTWCKYFDNRGLVKS